MAKKKKVRVDLRKNRNKLPRERQWTRGFQEHGFEEEATSPGRAASAPKGNCRVAAPSSRRKSRPNRAAKAWSRCLPPRMSASAGLAG